ncbi:hypothetical protein [Flavobacterium sp. H122]|uniref:hypothetical protein n=1 Tax=Flavobacterium sp. H122 TaxID=2529860 RepID=UPI001B7D82FB|nr:hypothetical protein [Flavobacterium sp. H122]
MKTFENNETLQEIKEVQSTTFQFRTPAGVQDFGDNPIKQDEMNKFWSNNLDGFTQQGMLNNPWNSTNTPKTTNYYNPIENNPTSETASIKWMAFPGRLGFNFPNATQAQLNEMADTGDISGQITNSPCSTDGQQVAYFPYGPRGWQDEYCEWSVTRNAQNKIIRIDFTCENPEYWNTLWKIDPNKVLELYQTVLGKPQITLEDLSLPGVVNPITNQPVYNPLNKWNSGTVSSDTQGGAMHLTSTPNTLQTEIGLATTSTVQRFNPPTNTSGSTMWPSSQYNDLICVGVFGQRFRNSDPNIGGNVNNFVTGGNMVTLADPPGLYIQMPDFSNYETPDGTNASAFWTIKRGCETLNDQNGGSLPGNFILHAVFEVPEDKGYTVSDIKISEQYIDWASQIAATFKMQIVASAYTGTTPQGYGPVGTPTPENTFAQPLQIFYQDYFDQMYNTLVPNPVNNPISLLSNSTYVPLSVNVGTSATQMVVVAGTCTAKENDPSTYPSITFNDPNISAVVTSVKENIFYAVPGNSQPSTNTALYITVTVNSNAAIGQKSVYVTNPGQSGNAAMPALFLVTPVTVQADIAWQNTGVVISANNTAKISYVSGLWTANPQDNNGQLYDANGNPNFIAAKPGYTMPGQNEGALIGKVGNTVFLVGMGTTLPSNLSGEIQLCINDDLNGEYGAGLTDNLGSIVVSIDVQ